MERLAVKAVAPRVFERCVARQRAVFALWLALCGIWAAQGPARGAAQSAQARQPASQSIPHRLLLLRVSGAERTQLAQQVEGALGRALSELGFLVTTSPVPFEEAQLAAGCSGGVRACGSQVAQVLESEHLAVGVLEDEAAANEPGLWLFVFESGGLVREGFARVPRVPNGQLERRTRGLVERVAGALAVAQVVREHAVPLEHQLTPSAPQSQVANTSSSSGALQPVSESRAEGPALQGERKMIIRTVGWSTLAVGSAMLVGALATSVAAENASATYAHSDVRSRADADAALAHYEAAERRADAARVLWSVGAATTASAAVMLLWQRFARTADRNLHAKHAHRQTGASAERRPLAMAVLPAPHGASLAFRGELW